MVTSSNIELIVRMYTLTTKFFFIHKQLFFISKSNIFFIFNLFREMKIKIGKFVVNIDVSKFRDDILHLYVNKICV